MDNSNQLPIDQSKQQPIVSPVVVHKSKASFFILITLVILIILAGIVYLSGLINIIPPKQSTVGQKFPTPTIDPVAGWKTYIDPQKQFSIKYPPSWETKDEQNGVLKQIDIFNPNNMVYESRENGKPPPKYYPTQFVNIDAYPATESAKEIVDSEARGWQRMCDESKLEKPCRFVVDMKQQSSVINNMPAEIYSEQGEGSRGRIVVISNGKYLANLNISIEDPKQDSLINQILSTFKFINDDQSTDTSNWKTYTNQRMGISFNYPQNWEFKENFLLGVDAKGIKSYAAIPQRIEIAPNGYNKTQSVIYLTYYDNPDNLSLKDLDKKNTGASGMSPNIYFQDDKQVKLQDGSIGYFGKCILDGPIKDCQRYVIPRKYSVYLIFNVISQPQNIPDQNDIFNHIFSTFKFINDDQSTGTSDWKTYQEADFSFMYPPNLMPKRQDWGILLGNPKTREVINLRKQTKPFSMPSKDQAITIFWFNSDGSIGTNSGLAPAAVEDDGESNGYFGTKIKRYSVAWGEGAVYNVALFQNGNTYYELISAYPDGEWQYHFDQILSTFKFL